MSRAARFAIAVSVLCTLASGCLRFGYDSRASAARRRPDAGTAAMSGKDAGAQVDAGERVLDAAIRDAAVMDAASDAGLRDATAPVSDAATQNPKDSGAIDSGRPDSGSLEGGVRDAATPDAGSSDAATDAGTPCSSRTDALFCDGFEQGGAVWDYTVINNGAADPSNALAHTGSYALHSTTGAASGSATNAARWGERVFPHVTSGEIWVRYFYYLPSTTNVTTFFSSGVMAQIEQPYFGFSLLIYASGVNVEVGSGNNMYPGTMSFPRDRWACVELHTHIDATAGYFEAYIDGALAARTIAMNTVPSTGFTSVDIGIHYTEPTQGPVEVFSDDVVAGYVRPGCN